MPYGNTAQILPFFYYQFYTFEDRYSRNGAGLNPVFNDSQHYEVTFDNSAISYFQNNAMELTVFDDAAGIGGIEWNDDGLKKDGHDDIIGSCKIPLTSLANSCSYQDRYELRAPKSGHKVGTIEVRISISDLEPAQRVNQSFFEVTKRAHYEKGWENELIMRIARKLV